MRWNKRELCIMRLQKFVRTTVFRFISVLQHSQEHSVFICCIVLSFGFCVCSWIRLQLILSIRIPCSTRTTRKTSFVNSTFLGIFRSHCSTTSNRRKREKLDGTDVQEIILNIQIIYSRHLWRFCVNEQSNVIQRLSPRFMSSWNGVPCKTAHRCCIYFRSTKEFPCSSRITIILN